MKVKKRHVLLLEVMIAMTLLLLCFYPFMHNGVKILLEEKKFVKDLTFNRLLHLEHLKTITSLVEEGLELGERPIEIMGIPVVRKISSKKEKNAQAPGEKYHLLEITYTCNGVCHTYLLFAQIPEALG